MSGEGKHRSVSTGVPHYRKRTPLAPCRRPLRGPGVVGVFLWARFSLRDMQHDGGKLRLGEKWIERERECVCVCVRERERERERERAEEVCRPWSHERREGQALRGGIHDLGRWGNDPKSHGARPVHLIIKMIKWIRTSRLSIKNSLCTHGSRLGMSNGLSLARQKRSLTGQAVSNGLSLIRQKPESSEGMWMGPRQVCVKVGLR